LHNAWLAVPGGLPNVKTPVFFIHGLHDQIIDRAESKKIFDALGSLQKEYHTFPGGQVSFPLHVVTEAVFQFIVQVLV
jgi:fermentation-respiration switch protein FrsA (DUF1100 family)